MDFVSVCLPIKLCTCFFDSLSKLGLFYGPEMGLIKVLNLLNKTTSLSVGAFCLT